MSGWDQSEQVSSETTVCARDSVIEAPVLIDKYHSNNRRTNEWEMEVFNSHFIVFPMLQV